MKARLEIRRNSDGVVRLHPREWDWYDDREEPEFIWVDGNFACDCNRAIFFEDAIAVADPERECGTGAYAVRLTALDGTVLYSEFDA